MSPEELAQLDAERDALLMSLEDLEREHEAGDLSEEDYLVLRSRYTARAAHVLRSIEVSPVAFDGSDAHEKPVARPPKRRRRRRRWLAVCGSLAILLAIALVLVLRATSSRLPGETVSGSVSLARQQQVQRTLAQAQLLEGEGDATQALALYHRVLEQDPSQPEALAESGWLEFQAGAQAKDPTLLSKGQEDEEKAEQADPRAYTAHLYLGSMLLAEGDASAAVAQYRSFLSEGPPSSVVRSAAPFVDRAFDDSGLVPPVLP
ncbi:MAG TPA: tetratricopeptide repeat protein [Acidimicrobiales bacterium]|nr:tetratricopeptide repeat protein [Acidimicrobiales bacterium]